MSRYKETEVGEIPEEWRVMSLLEASLEITDGSHFSPREEKGGQYHIATVANITDGKIDVKSCKKVSKGDYDLLVKNGCKAERGNILFSKDGTVGICFVFNQEEDIALLSSIAIIRPKEILDSAFGSYVLRSHKVLTRIEGAKTGTGLKRIILKDLKRISIPLPLLPEQRAIASVLSTVDEAIAKADEAIAKTERLKTGIMDKLLTKGIGHTKFKKTEVGESPEDWNAYKIMEVMEIINPKLESEMTKQYKDSGKIPIVDQGKELVAGYSDDEKKIFDKIPVIVFGDHTKIIKWIDFPFILGASGTKLIISKKSDLSLKFAYYALQTVRIPKKNEGYARHSMELMRQNICLPPLPEQRVIADVLSTVDNKLSLEKSRKQKLERIKHGLMDELLTGRKRVKINI